MAVSDIGHNYASALMEALRTPDQIQRAGRDLETVDSLLRQVPGLARVLEHPSIPAERRLVLLDQALDEIEPLAEVRRLLRLVLERGRLRQVHEMVLSYAALRDARLGVVAAEVVTAVPLDQAARAEWDRTVARLTGRNVRVSYRTDPTILGGALTRVGSIVYDGSLKKQLARIRGVLLGGSA